MGKRKRPISSVCESATEPDLANRQACAIATAAPSASRKPRACSVDPPTTPPPRSVVHTPEQRRARSLDPSPSRLRLTRENIRSFNRHTTQSSSMSGSRYSSPTRKDTALTEKKTLAGYNITSDEGIALPEQLAEFVQTLKRSREEEPSPHAQAIINTRRAASVENEITALLMLEEHILFRGESYEGGIRGLTLKTQVNLVKDYLPEPPRATVLELWGALVRPQPDSCIGYITRTEANSHSPASTMPFSREENDMADCSLANPVYGFNVVHNAVTHFPFLTAQWKSAFKGENQVHASLQAARDGALIVNYMHLFYSLAYPHRAPTQLETCHFSITTEGYTIILWIHWREVGPDEETYFRMEPVEMARMINLNDLLELRKILHNYVDFALGERLSSIKNALPAFWPNRPEKKVKKPRSQTSATSLRLDMLMTPSNSVGESANREEVAAKRQKRNLEKD